MCGQVRRIIGGMLSVCLLAGAVSILSAPANAAADTTQSIPDLIPPSGIVQLFKRLGYDQKTIEAAQEASVRMEAARAQL